MKPYYEADGVTIYCGDCRDVLPHVSADLLLTDPPYGLSVEGPGQVGRPGKGVRALRFFPNDSLEDGMRHVETLLWAANSIPVLSFYAWFRHQQFAKATLDWER